MGYRCGYLISEIPSSADASEAVPRLVVTAASTALTEVDDGTLMVKVSRILAGSTRTLTAEANTPAACATPASSACLVASS